jgi:DNA polymerase elongation subunit (family B)
MDKIKQHLANGATIKWVGYHDRRTVWVHLYHNNTTIREIVELKEDYTEPSFRQVYSSSAAEPASVRGTIWNSDSRLELLRLASILGLNPGANCQPGAGHEFKGKMGCIMAYDIEQDRSRLPLSSFPTPSESITCIATYCSCGEKRLFSFIRNVEFDYIQCRNSKDTVSKFMDYAKSHSPQWLAGYNNFRYDNTCLAFHADPRYDSVFIRMKVGSGSSLSYAFYIDIEGVYNIDILTYLDKTRRSTYTNMSLATLVKHHEVGEKMDFDTADNSDLERLFEYNIHDSRITMELARASNMITEITSLAVVACSPIIDCVRFVSGTLAACSIASYCLEHKISMDWSPCAEIKEYRGAEVLKPIIGLHEDVVSCDFSSMYPTVLMGANISIENCIETPQTGTNGAAWDSDAGTTFVVDDVNVTFDRRTDCIIPPVMRLFVERRKQVRKSNPSYALGLKVAANSIYGSLGDRHSRIYSPNCSASVTTGGRWCLATAEVILKVMGYQVVYGDTDSCFVASTGNVRTDVHTATKILSHIFSHTPFPGMSMEVENRYTKIAFLGKKTYFGKVEDGPIISKGMSKSRKDRIGICRTFSSLVVPVILTDIPLRTRQVVIGDMLSIVVDAIVGNALSLQQISKIVKRGGTNYYVYKTTTGEREWKDCESSTGLEIVPYSSGYISKAVRSEIESIFAITAMGSMASIMRASDLI